ncbi:MAG: cupin domain-containing protein [Candidatus Thorarchaeota archaeon]
MKVTNLKERILEIKKSKDGTLVLELEKNNDYSLAYGELQPGEKNNEHKMEMQEVFYILSGKGIITIEEEKKAVKKDSMIVVPIGKKQSMENTGKKKMRFLMIVNPPYDENKEKIIKE